MTSPIIEILGQGLDKYKSLFPHVSAAILLANRGRTMIAGEGVEYIFTNSSHVNPLYRVAPRALIEENGIDYDKEKYRDMLLEAAETVLSIFGFNRRPTGTCRRKGRNGCSGLTRKEQEIGIQKEYSTEDFSLFDYDETLFIL